MHVSLKKVTIVAERLLKDPLVKLIRDAGASGHTLLAVEGEGSRGVHASDWEGRNAQIETIVSAKVEERILEHAARTLDEFGVPWDAKVVSAHRPPALLDEYAEQAAGRGLQCIIAGARSLWPLAGTASGRRPSSRPTVSKLHIYGRNAARPGRKLGHVTFTAPTLGEALAGAKQCREALGWETGVSLDADAG